MTNQYAIGYKAGLEAAVKECKDVLKGETNDSDYTLGFETAASNLAIWISALPVPDHLPDATKMVGCAYCDNPLFAGTKCNNCGRVTLALPVQEPVALGVDWGKDGDQSCVSIIKKHSDGTIEVVAVEYSPNPVRTKDLTDDELHQIWRDIKSLVGLYSFQEIARAVIAADREKNK